MNPTFNPALDIKESAEVSLNACAKNEQPEEPVNNEYPCLLYTSDAARAT